MLDLSWLEISSHWQECRDGKDPGMARIPEAVLESTRGSTGEYRRQYWRVPEAVLESTREAVLAEITRGFESWRAGQSQSISFYLLSFLSVSFLFFLFPLSKEIRFSSGKHKEFGYPPPF